MLIGIAAIGLTHLAMSRLFPPIDLRGPSKAERDLADRELYGSFYKDHLFCEDYMKHCTKRGIPPLSRSQVQRLYVLQRRDNEISFDATSVLGVYAYRHPRVMRDQRAAIPALLRSESGFVEGSAYTVSRFTHEHAFDAEFAALKQRLKSKRYLTQSEKVLLWQLGGPEPSDD